MGLFKKDKAKDGTYDEPEFAQFAHSADLDVLDPPSLPAASGQRSTSHGSVNSLNESKGYTLRGKLGLVKAPENVFDGFDGAQVPEQGFIGYDDSIYGNTECHADNLTLEELPTPASASLEKKTHSQANESFDFTSDQTSLPGGSDTAASVPGESRMTPTTLQDSQFSTPGSFSTPREVVETTSLEEDTNIETKTAPQATEMSRQSTNDLVNDFNRMSLSSHVAGMGLPLDQDSITSREDGNTVHDQHIEAGIRAGDEVNHGHVIQPHAIGMSTSSHMMMLAEPSQAEILRASYVSTDEGQQHGHSRNNSHDYYQHESSKNNPHDYYQRGHSRNNSHEYYQRGHSRNNSHDYYQRGHSRNNSQDNYQSPHNPDLTYYPAPIPMNLKLPPLLSKKNRRKSKMGYPTPRDSSFSPTLDRPPGSRASFLSPWSHTADGSLLYYEGYTDSPEGGSSERSVCRMTIPSRGSSPLKEMYTGEGFSQPAEGSDEIEDPYYNPDKRGRRRTMSLTSINVNMDKSEIREDIGEEVVEGEVTDMERYEASANAFTRVHIDANVIAPPSASSGLGNGVIPGFDQKPGTLVEELELRKKDKKAVRAHVNQSMHQYATHGTETPLIQQINDSTSAYGMDDRRQSMVTSMTMPKDHSYEEPNQHRMSLLALDSLAKMDYNQSYSKPGAAQISKQYRASREDDEPLRVRKQRLKRQSELALQQRQLQENLEKQRLAAVEQEQERQKARTQRRNQFGQNAAAQGAQKKGKVLIGPGGEVIKIN